MIGFDFGTSNCAVGAFINNQPQLITLGEHGNFIPSTLYAPDRDVISSWLSGKIPHTEKQSFLNLRTNMINKGQRVIRELNYDGIDTELYFGLDALNRYLEEPDEGYYIKSPKSFLGASGLVKVQVDLFEDIIAAMMSNIKTLTESRLNKEITETVIGRPVNFQGINSSESNKQAISILTNAAKRVGFKEVEFQYEPVAAGFAYEATINEEQKVLVVDIGGGTTDCSMLLMGPNYVNQNDRSQHLLSHSGIRIGGNDFDIQLALKGIMPSFGMDSSFKNNQPMPVNYFKQAVSTNSVKDQSEFYSAKNRRELEQLIRDAKSPEILQRLLKIHDHKLSYRIVNAAEQSKKALTDNSMHKISLDDIEDGLHLMATRPTLESATENLLIKIGELMDEAMQQASCRPDVVFVTGGTAKSPSVSNFIKAYIPNTPIIIGDHFGSVTLGLTRWAQKAFS